MIKKIFLLFIFFWYFLWAYWFEARLDVSDNEVDLWQDFVIRLEVYSDTNLSLQEINKVWMKDFQIIWTSQSTSTRIVNNIRETYIIYDFRVIPINEWEFIIWPFEVKTNLETKETNKIKIKVKPVDIPNNQKQKEINIDLIIVITIIILLFNLIIWYLYIKYKNEKQKLKQYTTRKTKSWLDNPNMENFISKLNNYEIENLNADSIRDILLVFLSIILKKSLKSKTNTEIIELLNNSNLEKNFISEVVSLLEDIQKTKYSKEKVDLKVIFSKIKMLINNFNNN